MAERFAGDLRNLVTLYPAAVLSVNLLLDSEILQTGSNSSGSPFANFFASNVILANTLTDVTGDEEDGAGSWCSPPRRIRGLPSSTSAPRREEGGMKIPNFADKQY